MSLTEQWQLFVPWSTLKVHFLLHNTVQWLSQGKALVQFVVLWAELTLVSMGHIVTWNNYWQKTCGHSDMGLAGSLFTMNKMSLTHQEKLTGLVGYGTCFFYSTAFHFSKSRSWPPTLISWPFQQTIYSLKNTAKEKKGDSQTDCNVKKTHSEVNTSFGLVSVY